MNPENEEVLGGMSKLLMSLSQGEYIFKSFIDNFVCAPESYDFQSSKVTLLRMRIQTIKYMVEASYLISLNRSFISNEAKSLRILKPILLLLNCPNIICCLSKDDILHMLAIINNILKLSESNALYFHQSDRLKEVLSIATSGTYFF